MSCVIWSVFASNSTCDWLEFSLAVSWYTAGFFGLQVGASRVFTPAWVNAVWAPSDVCVTVAIVNGSFVKYFHGVFCPLRKAVLAAMSRVFCSSSWSWVVTCLARHHPCAQQFSFIHVSCLYAMLPVPFLRLVLVFGMK